MKGRGGVAFVAAGAAILLLAWWLRNPLVPYDSVAPDASDLSADSARGAGAVARRDEAIREFRLEILSTQRSLARIAVAALEAPEDPAAAFRYVRRLPDSPEVGVLLLEGRVPLAWGGQIRTPPAITGTGTSVAFSPFHTTLQVAVAKGKRDAVATALVHAEPPASGVARAIDTRLEGRKLVGAFRFAPPSDTSAGELVTGVRGQQFFRVDATPLSAEMVRFHATAAARARGTVLLTLGILLLLGVAWSDRRAIGLRLFAVAVGLAAIAIVPWNHLSNFSRAFDPIYYYSPLAGPFSASAAVFGMFGGLVVMAVIAMVRARMARPGKLVAGVGAVAMVVAGIAIAETAASGIALPIWGSTWFLWLAWQVPIFLVTFACWLAAFWLGRIAAGRTGAVQLRGAALVAVVAGAVATFVVWNSTTEQRLQLAMRDVAGLQREEFDAALLLGRFAEQLSVYDSPGTRADVLKRFAVSDLAPAEVQVSLGMWSLEGAHVAQLDLAPLPFDSVQLSALVTESIRSGDPVIRQLLGPTGRQIALAVPHRAGGATSIVASPRTRLIEQDPYAALLGFRQPGQAEPPYSLMLADVTEGAPALAGRMTWRRLGDEWHGDEVVQTSLGPARAHVEVDLRSWPNRLVRASLIIVLDIVVVGLLWSLGATAEGGFFRWLRARSTKWARSYRGRLTLALFTFFVVPAVAFAAWSNERLRGDDRQVRELLVRERLRSAAGDDPMAPRLNPAGDETPLFLYRDAMLASSSDPLYEMIAPAGRFLPGPVYMTIATGGELTATWRQGISNSQIFWGFRTASSSSRVNYILAAPARADELVLDRRRRDLTLLVLFATAVGGIAAFWLSGIAARILARDLELSRIEVSRAERVLAWGEMARQVAHEIKNPLTPIRLGVQHLRRARADSKIDFDQVLDENVTRILSEINRLDEIARAFSRYGSAPADLAPAEQVDVAAILRDVVGLERIGIGDVSWELRGADDLLHAQARADELRDVLLNVFENARLSRARNVTVTLSHDANAAVIAIDDDGSGIESAALPRVFEPHFSTRTTGSGLGLAISRRLLESWGGSIDLASEAGRGVRVTITLRRTRT